FCERYRRFRSKLDVVLRQHHRAGEKMFVDYSGDGIEITDPRTGKTKTAELFVAVLGASSYTYAEATPTQKLKDWILAHIHAFEFFQGVPGVTVPDNLRSAVTNPCRYEPDLNPTYLEMARHYGTVVIPARPRKPRDKAKAEIGVLLAQRWILAALRNHTFFSIRQANDAIAAKLQLLNHRKFQKLDTTRQELYETIDKPALGPLPSCRYEFAEWLKVRVNIDYHIQVKKHYYSVPYQLVHQQLEVRLTSTTLEALHRGRRVASHLRCDVPFAFETLKEHMPKSHQKHLEWTPSRILHWAEKVGQQTARLVQVVLESRPHPEQGYRSCLGLLRLGKSYGQERLEAACTRALATGACSYRSVKSILSTGLDRLPPPQNHRPRADLPREHGNIRGPAHYQ
ncbi:MAG: IS21 family transposase, partial [Planctomycetota bacterium]